MLGAACSSEGDSAGGAKGAAASSTTATTGKQGPQFTPFTADDAHFRASFPSRPKRSEDDVPASGQTLRVVQYLAELDKHTGYGVGWFRLQQAPPPDSAKQVLEGAMNGSIGAVEGTLIENTELQHKGHPAMEYLASARGGFIQARIVLVGRDVYFVQVTSDKGDERELPHYKEFVESFEVLPAP